MSVTVGFIGHVVPDALKLQRVLGQFRRIRNLK
jgi:hypothetical protein